MAAHPHVPAPAVPQHDGILQRGVLVAGQDGSAPLGIEARRFGGLEQVDAPVERSRCGAAHVHPPPTVRHPVPARDARVSWRRSRPCRAPRRFRSSRHRLTGRRRWHIPGRRRPAGAADRRDTHRRSSTPPRSGPPAQYPGPSPGGAITTGRPLAPGKRRGDRTASGRFSRAVHRPKLGDGRRAANQPHPWSRCHHIRQRRDARVASAG